MQNKRILAAVLASAMCLSSLAGCGSTTTTTTTSTSTSGASVADTSSESKSEGYADGTFEQNVAGYGGNMKVSVTVSGGAISAVEVLEHKETEGIGTNAIDQLPEAFVTGNSAVVDVVAGATVTSHALIEAVNSAINPSTSNGEMVTGKYTTKAHGQESYVYVATTIIDNAIASVQVLTHHETVGIGTYAVDAMPAAIVEAQSVNIDGVSGATLTSNAIKTAVKEAITLAGGNLSDFSTPSEKVYNENEVVETVDVAIMGAGTAGIIAGNILAEQGVNVLIFEKMDIPGGAMSTTYSGVLSMGSELEMLYNRTTQEDAQAKIDSYMAYYENSVVPENALNEGFPYWGQVLNASGSFVNWLHDSGVGFLSMNDKIGSTPYMSPGAYQGGVGYALQYLVDKFEKDGGRIIYATPVTDLIQDESGTITGLVAEGEDGTTYTVNAKAVLLASGGFAANQEMIAEHYPQYADMIFNCTPGSTGDGILLGQEYGAGIDSMGRTLGAFMSDYNTNYELAFMHYSSPGLIVNINGDSIGNFTSANHSVLGREKLNEENGDTFYYVMDEAARYSTKRSNYAGLSYNVSYEPVFETGSAVFYDSLEAAATALNLPNLSATVETNNGFAIAGEPDETGRKNLPYLDTTNGVYLLRVDPTFYVTTGGLSANLDGQILTTEGEVIKGLYGAGDVLGSLEEKDGLKYGYGFDSAMIFGYIVAENILQAVR